MFRATRLRYARVLATAPAAILLLSTPPEAQAQGDDHTIAQTLVTSLEHDSAHASVLAEPIARAHDALEQATRLRTVGDEAHARAADGLAREWAETGRDLARASDAEQQAADLQKKALESQARLSRTRTLVEEAIARVGRLSAEIAQANRAGSEPRSAREIPSKPKNPPSAKP
ncbi:MAG TPA: hypothetical protein VGY54_10875 [Polyangiaceae bacterium]|jgi:hypothetical protein|nr:hypothetical protein [Polyangiaceae bacterium]